MRGKEKDNFEKLDDVVVVVVFAGVDDLDGLRGEGREKGVVVETVVADDVADQVDDVVAEGLVEIFDEVVSDHLRDVGSVGSRHIVLLLTVMHPRKAYDVQQDQFDHVGYIEHFIPFATEVL